MLCACPVSVHGEEMGLENQYLFLELQYPFRSQHQYKSECRDDNFANCPHGKRTQSLLFHLGHIGAQADARERKQESPAF